MVVGVTVGEGAGGTVATQGAVVARSGEAGGPESPAATPRPESRQARGPGEESRQVTATHVQGLRARAR